MTSSFGQLAASPHGPSPLPYRGREQVKVEKSEKTQFSPWPPPTLPSPPLVSRLTIPFGWLSELNDVSATGETRLSSPPHPAHSPQLGNDGEKSLFSPDASLPTSLLLLLRMFLYWPVVTRSSIVVNVIGLGSIDGIIIGALEWYQCSLRTHFFPAAVMVRREKERILSTLMIGSKRKRNTLTHRRRQRL